MEEHLGERGAVVGQEHEVVRCAAHLDVEQRLVGESGAGERRDDGACSLALRCVHRRAVRMVEVAQLGVGARERERLAVLGAKMHPSRIDGEDLRRVAVHEVGRLGAGEARTRRFAVAGPADALAGADVDRLGVEHAEVARRIARGAEAAGRAVGVGELDFVVADSGDGADVVAPASVGVAVEHHRVAFGVAPGVGGIGAGQAPVDEARDGEGGAVQRPFQRKSLADGGVNLAAHRMGGGEQRGLGAGIVGEREPDAARGLAKRLAGGLLHPFAESAKRQVRMALARVGDRGGQGGIALAQHLVHHRRRHAGPLEHAEGLAGVHRAKLAGVSDEHHPRDVEGARDAKERLHLRRPHHRRLVHDEHRVGERVDAVGDALGVGQVAVAGEEPLERAGLDAGGAFE